MQNAEVSTPASRLIYIFSASFWMMLFYFYLLNGRPFSGVVLAFYLFNGAYLHVIRLLGFQLADGLLYRLAGFHDYGLRLF